MKTDRDSSSPAPDQAPRVRRLSRWNRWNLRLLGPPSIGRYDGPYPQVDPDPDCPFCGRPESEHETFRSADAKTLRRCPTK